MSAFFPQDCEGQIRSEVAHRRPAEVDGAYNRATSRPAPRVVCQASPQEEPRPVQARLDRAQLDVQRLGGLRVGLRSRSWVVSNEHAGHSWTGREIVSTCFRERERRPRTPRPCARISDATESRTTGADCPPGPTDLSISALISRGGEAGVVWPRGRRRLPLSRTAVHSTPNWGKPRRPVRARPTRPP